MIIDFEKLTASVNMNFKGGEGEFGCAAYSDNNIRIMKGTLAPGASIGMHKHVTNSETLIVLSGSGAVLENGVMQPIGEGMSAYCAKGDSHSLINNGNVELVFFAVIAEQ